MGVKAYRGRLLVDEFDFSLDTFSASLEHGGAAGVVELAIGGDAVSAGPSGQSVDDERLLHGQRCRRHLPGDDGLGTETAGLGGVAAQHDGAGQPAYRAGAGVGINVTVDTPVNDLLKFAGTFGGIASGLTLLDGAGDGDGQRTVITLPAAGRRAGRRICSCGDYGHGGRCAGDDRVRFTVVGMTTPTDKGSITFSDVGVYTLDLSGTVETYVRVVIDDLGGANFTAALVLCVADVTM